MGELEQCLSTAKAVEQKIVHDQPQLIVRGKRVCAHA
jgi:hypothetical protein